MKRLITLLIIVTFLILGCMTAESDFGELATKIPDQEDYNLTGVVKSEGDNIYQVKFDENIDRLDFSGTIMLQIIEDGYAKITAGLNYRRGISSYEMISNSNDEPKNGDTLKVFFDANDNFLHDKEEWFYSENIKKNGLDGGVEIGFNADLKSGEDSEPEILSDNSAPASRQKTGNLDFIKSLPTNTHNLLEKPDPPAIFEKRENEGGIGLIDFNYNKPVWIYGDMTLEQIHTLLPDARRNDRVFYLNKGGFVVINFAVNGSVSMFYPRGTTRFTLIGFPKLPWYRNDVVEIFGDEAEEVMKLPPQFLYIRSDYPELNGLRLDMGSDRVTGFRIWRPGFKPSGTNEG